MGFCEALWLHSLVLLLKNVLAESFVVGLDHWVVDRNRQKVCKVAFLLPTPSLLLLDVATWLLAFPTSLLVISLQITLLGVCDNFAQVLVVEHRHSVLSSADSNHFKLVVTRAGLLRTTRVNHLLNHFSSDLAQLSVYLLIHITS